MTNPEKRFVWYEMAGGDERTPLPYHRLSKAVNYWDWILPAVMRIGRSHSINVKMLSSEELLRTEIERSAEDSLSRLTLEQWDTDLVYHPEMHERLKEQFGYRYPYESGRNQKLKFTVSELKKRIYLRDSLGEEMEESGEMLCEEPEVVPLIPKFLQEEEELTGASRGTAYHRLLELLDFAEISDDYDEILLTRDIERYVREGRLGAEEADCISHRDILKFLHCPSGQRMCASARYSGLWKEQPFVLGVDAREIYPEEAEGELILVQGIIDVYFQETDGLVVLDYKTDHVYSPDALVERYHAQLDYYAKALERMTGKTVKEKIIYSFTLGKEIVLN